MTKTASKGPRFYIKGLSELPGFDDFIHDLPPDKLIPVIQVLGMRGVLADLRLKSVITEVRGNKLLAAVLPNSTLEQLQNLLRQQRQG